MSALSELFGALAGVPSLPGARCRGRPHLFDPPAADEAAEATAARHAQAVGLCQRCPARDACEAWFVRLKPARRPLGVIAGRVNPGKPRAT